jgi:hypothetical protein
MPIRSASGSAMVETDWSTPSKSVEGGPVYKRDGERLGTIDHIMLDRSSGRQYAVLLATPLGIGERYYPVPWTKLAYDAPLGGYIADIDLRSRPARGRAIWLGSMHGQMKIRISAASIPVKAVERMP